MKFETLVREAELLEKKLLRYEPESKPLVVQQREFLKEVYRDNGFRFLREYINYLKDGINHYFRGE